MKHPTKLAIWLGAILGTCCALLLNAHSQASDRSGQFTEEFHHVYPLSANGRLELDNINWAVHITAWDRNEVKVDAVKSARVKERLDEARIVVDASPNSVSIRTESPLRSYQRKRIGQSRQRGIHTHGPGACPG